MKNNIEFETKITKRFKKKFDSIVKKSKSLVITSHILPDDDSISSVLSIYYYLTNILKIDSKIVRIIYTGDKNDKWKPLLGFEKINFVDDLFNYITVNDTLIMLDGGAYKRFSRKEEMNNFSGITICIDHHPIPGNQFSLQLIAKQYTSTSEIIYRLFFEEEKMNKEICEILLLGIIGDTGGFRYIDNNKANVLSVAEKLITNGEINVDLFLGQFQKINKNSYEILVELMKNSCIMKIKNWPDFMFSSIDAKFCLKKGYSDIDIGGGSSSFMIYLKAIEGVDWGMVVTPRFYDKTHSVSFRSLPKSVVTREIGEKMGIGGGHDRASGGKILTDDTKTAIEIIFNWMKKNKPSFS